MKPKIAVYGNQALNIGHGIASDLSLAGYEVNLFDLPRFHETLMPIQKLGGIYVTGEPKALASGKTGFSKISMITTDPEEALKDADVLFVDVPAHDYETRMETIAPYIKDGAIINFNNYGYWPCLRAAEILKRFNKKNIILTECPAPFYVARGSDGYIDFSLMRMGIPLSVFPSKRSKEAFDVLSPMYPTFKLAKNVLHTNFENLNMMGHAGIALLNVAYFDRVEEHGDRTAFFYRTGITRSTGLLSESQDKERIEVCKAFDVPYTSFLERMTQYYGGKGGTMASHQLDTKFIQGIPAYAADIWALWIRADVPLAMVPFVQLAELAGISTPIYRGFIDIFGAILETDFWETGLSLGRLGLAGLSKAQIIDYVMEG